MRMRTAINAWSFLFVAVELVMLLIAPGMNPWFAILLGFPLATVSFFLLWKPVDIESFQTLVIWRAGRLIDTRLSGRRAFLFRRFEYAIRVDMRFQEHKVGPVSCLTKDGVPVDISYYFRWKVIDPVLYLQTLEDVPNAIENIATAVLGDIIAGLPLSQLVIGRGQISNSLRQMKSTLAQEVRGVTVERIDLESIAFPHVIKEAIARMQAIDFLRPMEIAQAETSAQAVKTMVELLQLPETEKVRLLLPMLTGEAVSQEWMEQFAQVMSTYGTKKSTHKESE